jgi:hypothetical protein
LLRLPSLSSPAAERGDFLLIKEKTACHPELVEGLRGEACPLCFDKLSMTPNILAPSGEERVNECNDAGGESTAVVYIFTNSFFVK